MADGDQAEEPEVESHLSAVEGMATYDPEEHVLAGDDDPTSTSSCCESTTRFVCGSSTDNDDGATPAKRARLHE